MKYKIFALFFVLSAGSLYSQTINQKGLEEQFRNPPFEYRSFFPFKGAGGGRNILTGTVQEQLNIIYNQYGFGGIMFAPTTDKRFTGSNDAKPGYLRHIGSGLQKTLPAGSSPWLETLPEGASPYRYSESSSENTNPLPAYLSKEYFDQVREILIYSKENNRKVVFYDEVGYPSGIANRTTPEKFYRKILEKEEYLITDSQEITLDIPENGVLMAIVAMNPSTLERINLISELKNNVLNWKSPEGTWKIIVFRSITSKPSGSELDYRIATDYLDTEAADWFVNAVYEPHLHEIGKYFGNTVFQGFFDDVGIFDEERTWTNKFNDHFIKNIGIDPAIYYPALWENIGAETEAARVAFFDTRAELLADGFPKILTEWGDKHNLEMSGHCPGNYDIQPVDMNGDPFKFYRAQPVPMVDVIFTYPTGRDGFKLVSDGADYYDKPIVAAETFNSFSPAGHIDGYRRLMELYIRGINRLIGSGLPKTDVMGDTGTFSEWVGRSCLLLQGGQRVSEIAVFYPIDDLQAFFRFDAPEYTENARWGTFVHHDTDYLALGEMLLEHVHRDFTFLHPDFLLSDKMKIENKCLVLDNTINSQKYKVLIMPGQRVISLKALQKIKEFYDAGGIVVATSLLPSKASDLTGCAAKTTDNDLQVQAIIKEIFGIDSSIPMPNGVSDIRKSKNDGKSVFIRKPNGEELIKTFSSLQLNADVVFSGNPAPTSGGGMLSYLHKKKDNRDIYYFANSSNDAIDTFVEVRGKINPQTWNPSNGEISEITSFTYLEKNGAVYTRFPLALKAVSAMFVVSGN
jgi:hypothetical protein